MSLLKTVLSYNCKTRKTIEKNGKLSYKIILLMKMVMINPANNKYFKTSTLLVIIGQIIMMLQLYVP